jgi:metal-sulfur cluster biosynthetic enzyme
MDTERAVTRDELTAQLRRLAFGRANDCVRLVLDPDAPVDQLDLTLLTEVKRSDRGTVEVKLVDRLKAIELLQALCEEDDAFGFFGND